MMVWWWAVPETLPLIYLDYLLISFNEEKVIYFHLSTNIDMTMIELYLTPFPLFCFLSTDDSEWRNENTIVCFITD